MEKKKFKVGTFVKIFFVLLVILGVISYFLGRNPSNFQNTQNKEINWRIPAIPENFNWSEKDANEEDIKNNKIVYDDRFLRNKLEIPVSKDILAPGKIHSVTLTNKDWNYNNGGFAVGSLMKKNLESTGWSTSTRYGNHLISGIASSSIRGSVTGYVRVENKQVRTIVFSYLYDGNWITPENEPAYLQCPCSVNMTIFISDPVSLDQYIPNP